MARDGEEGGDESEVALYVVLGEYSNAAMAKAADVDAQASVPGALELTGYAGRGVGMSSSPPLEVRSRRLDLLTNTSCPLRHLPLGYIKCHQKDEPAYQLLI